MLSSKVEAHVHYRHEQEEVAALQRAIIPLKAQIHAVSTANERGNMSRILGGHYFRRRDAAAMRDMLIRAAKKTKASLGDYFDLLHPQLLRDAHTLETAVRAYWKEFALSSDEVSPMP
jgi:hypothetical protein